VTTHRADGGARNNRDRRKGRHHSRGQRRDRERADRRPSVEQVGEPERVGDAQVRPGLPSTVDNGDLVPAAPDQPVNGSESASALATSTRQPVLRQEEPPVDQRDFDDRHDTRATRDEVTLKRYITLDRQRTRREWHQTLQRLLTVVGGAIVYVAAFVALRHLLPDLSARQDMLVAGAAVSTPYAGHALRLGAETVKERYGRRRQGPRNGEE